MLVSLSSQPDEISRSPSPHLPRDAFTTPLRNEEDRELKAASPSQWFSAWPPLMQAAFAYVACIGQDRGTDMSFVQR